MAPAKRKRNDRGSVDGGESNRPSPHRPANTMLGQHEIRDGGARRASRGGGYQGGGRGGRRVETPSKLPGSDRTISTPAPMSPPVRPPSATQTPSQAQTPTQATTPTIEVQEVIPRPDPAPYDYIFLTDERMASWTSSGRQEVIAGGVQALQDEDTTDLAALLLEILRATADGRVDPTDAGGCIKEVLSSRTEGENASSFHGANFFLDIFSIFCDSEPLPFSPTLKQLAAATGISSTLMRQVLDEQVLRDLGLVKDTFKRMSVRYSTQVLYRQANYNLLREETEGYSKLVNELFVAHPPELPWSEVEVAFERVKGLIGTFDLDVGRVLDITLDVFAAVLIKQFRFFVRLLRLSSWWPRSDILGGAHVDEHLPGWAVPDLNEVASLEDDPVKIEEAKKEKIKLWEAKATEFRHDRDTLFWPRARELGLDAFFGLGGREILDAQSRKRILGDVESEDPEADADRQWVKVTGTLPPSGNRVAAQLLGFKLRFYASDARDNDDVLPANLLYLTALLIKIGFISLRDIYPHLWPLDEDMEAVREVKRKELEEIERKNRPGGAVNALMMAGALPDDTLPNNGKTRDTAASKPEADTKTIAGEGEKEKLDEPADQKVQLLTCLLTIGAIPESLFMLGRFPWLTEAYPQLIDLINRILLHSIKDIYASMCSPIASEPVECPTKPVADSNQTGMPKGEVRLVPIPTRKPLRWPYPDSNDTNDATSYRFYWDEWADNIPICQSVDDVFTLCGTLLNCSGVSIGKDSSLLSKLARIGNASLVEDPSPENRARWQDLLKRLLVPALSFTKSNTSIVNEIYDMLRHYPVAVRYSIYAEWFEGQISRLPVMKTAFARTTAETMAIMKRISMTNITTMARSLAKAAYASPGIVFRVALGQIEEYTNLTEVVVECAKYFTDLGYDVLVWSLMSSLGGKDRNRSSAEFALLPSQWLLALSRFAGKVFKRYSIINPSPILQYVNHQLHRGNSMDLQVLKELIAQMAGIVPNTDFTDAQLSAMTGRENLQRLTLINLQDRRYESVKTSKRLIKALTDTRLAGELLIAIAQYRQAAIYAVPDDDAHIKLLSTMIDDSQDILFQYLDMLRSNFSVEDFDTHVPKIPDLLTEFGLQPALAFMIGRASVLSQIATVTSPKVNGTSKTSPPPDAAVTKTGDADGDVEMQAEPTLVGDADDTSKEESETENKEATPTLKEQSPTVVADPALPPVDKFQQCLEPITTAISGLYDEDAWTHLTPEFYVTFWITTLSEIAVPKSSYENAIQRLLAQESEFSKPDRTDMTRAGIARRAEAKQAAAESKAAIVREWNQHMEYAQKLKIRFSKRKNFWFNQVGRADALSDDILEKCLFPRLLLSPTDADFCFSLVKYMHDTGTPHFRLLSLYSRLFRTHRLRSIIFTCTVREASNLGRFLRLVLTDLARWHNSAALYEKEALGSSRQNLIGFAKALDADGKPKGFLDHDGKSGFRNVLLAWHKNINSALRDCLDGNEWMHIRNAITVLKSVVEVFPAVDFMGNGFIKQLETIADREKDVREDLALLGNAVMVGLKKRSKKWVMVQAFGFSMVPPAKQNGSSTPSNQAASTPKASLNATAPEFKPRPSSAQSTSASTPKRAIEVEDGEVDDAKVSDATKKTGTDSKPVDEKKLTEATPPAAPAEPTKRSEILIRREQIQRENAAKAAAAQAAHPTPPPRHESSRPASGLGDRSNSALPSRPDAPFPSRQDLDRHPRNQDRRDARDTRLPDPNRLSRPVERINERSTERPGDRNRDFPGPDRRSFESNPRDFNRPSDRSAAPERLRPEPPPRWTPDSGRDQNRYNNDRGIEGGGRLSRENQPLPRSNVASDRPSSASSDRLPPVNPERQELINPERAALISTGRDSPRGESPRRTREDPRDRNTPRNQSPRRHLLDNESADFRRDDRPSRYGQEDIIKPRNDDPSLPPPAGPRGDRQTDRLSDRSGGERQPFQPTPHQSRVIDPEHGRLNPRPRPQADPNFGRLNSNPSSEIPSGPRDRTSRGNRPPHQGSNTTPRDSRLNGPRGQSPPTQTPTGPSSGRHPRYSNSGQFDDTLNSSPASTSNFPAAGSPTVGVHPDRARQLPAQAQIAPLPSPSAQSESPLAPGMHPDRARAYGSDGSLNQQHGRGPRQPVPPLSTTGPPSGPKQNQMSPAGASPNGMSAPTGPASAVERAQRGGLRQLAGINTMLQQGGSDRGIQVRGRGRMSAGGLTDSPIQNTYGQGLPPNQSQFPSPAYPDAAHDSADMVNPARADFIAGGPPTSDDRDRERTRRRDQSGHHSRRGSRSPGREREPKRNHGEDERPQRDHKDRRGGDRSDDRQSGHNFPHPELISRESKGSRSDDRESVRDFGRVHDRERSERDAGRGRENREREPRDPQVTEWNGERNDHRGAERGERASERGGRSRDMRGDYRNEERRDSRSNRGGDDGGRKRHSEEGMDSRGRDKRPRRG